MVMKGHATPTATSCHPWRRQGDSAEYSGIFHPNLDSVPRTCEQKK